MSRVSSKNIFRVQEQVNALKQQLSVVSNGLQRNAVAIAKLKEESNCVGLFYFKTFFKIVTLIIKGDYRKLPT